MTAMGDVCYAPGTLTAVAGDRCWVLIAETPDSPAVGWLWQQIGQRASAEAILAGLLGAGFAGAAEFALLYQQDNGAHRLFCRGAVAATVAVAGPGPVADPGPAAGGAAQALRIDGSGLLTWREHAVPGTVGRIVLGVPPAGGAPLLPATAGVLLASCVTVDLTDAAIRETAPYGPPPAVIQTVGDPVSVFADYPDTVTLTGAPAPAPAPATAPLPPPAATPLAPLAAGPPPAAAWGPPAVADEEYDFFWGATQARSVSDAAVRAPEAQGARPAAFPGGLIDAMPWGLDPAAPDEADESGFTVRRGDLPGLAARPAPPPDKIGPSVPALICPAGHANPPSEQGCRRCGAPLPPDPVVVPRPVLGALRLSTGDMISLDRDVIMGRNPKADFAGADGEERPHIVKLTGTDGDISRTHLRVSLDGWHVLVTDLNSTNGTLVTLPGREPEQLRPGHPMPVKPGTVVTLADGIDFRYEVPE
jgi:hypothetical protein